MKLIKSISLISAAVLIALTHGQPDPGDGDVSSHDCTDISGAGTIAKGRWMRTGDNGGLGIYSKNGQNFEYWQDYYHLFDEAGGAGSILGYCTQPNAQTIFECTGAYHNTVRDKPTARFATCFQSSRRRLRISGGGSSAPGSCWPASDPRIVSFVDTAQFIIIWGVTTQFMQLLADPDAGCVGGRPVYKTAPDLYASQFVIRYMRTGCSRFGCTDNYWELSYGSHPNKMRCDNSDVTQCVDWDEIGGGWSLNVFMYKNEYRACKNFESTRDVIVHGLPGGVSVPMSIDNEERCFFGRPAWSGMDTTNDINYYVSFEFQNNQPRWIVSPDYIDYPGRIDKCDGLGNLNECLSSNDWDGSTSVQVVTTGPYIVRKKPAISRRVYHDWPSWSVNTLTACAVINTAVMIAQHLYTRRAGAVKVLSDPEL